LSSWFFQQNSIKYLIIGKKTEFNCKTSYNLQTLYCYGIMTEI